MNDWLQSAGLTDIPSTDRAALLALPKQQVPRGTPLFHPGDAAQGFVVVLSGRVDVFLTGPSGRDILLYAVEPGQSCVQTTLGLLGGEPYTGEAIAATDSLLVMIPSRLFLGLDEHRRPLSQLRVPAPSPNGCRA